jgi:hypothetical protein
MLYVITLLWLLVSVVVGVVQAQASSPWEPFPESKVLAFRSQRDVSANVTIDQVSSIGVGLSNVIFEPYGYTLDSLEYVSLLMEAQVQNLVVDLYWNDGLRKFQLCPVPFNNNVAEFESKPIVNLTEGISCQVNMTVNDLLQTVEHFVYQTNTNLAANVITLIFNLFPINDGSDSHRIQYNESLLGSSNDTLSRMLSNHLGSELYTPAELTSSRESNQAYNASTNETDSTYGFPRLFPFLFDKQKRVVPIIWQNYIPSNSSWYEYRDTDTDTTILFTEDSLSAHFLPVSETYALEGDYTDRVKQSWRFAYDDNDDRFDDVAIQNLIDYGYSPILNHTLDYLSEIPTLFNYSLWSWAPLQPYNISTARAISDAESGDSDQALSQEAYQCASVDRDGVWRVTNCYLGLPTICRHATDEFRWILNMNNGSYFDAADDGCADGWIFTVPKTAIQQQSLTNYLNAIDIGNSEGAWIDMNSIAITDCWVTGGPYTSCPYQKLTARGNLIKMMTPPVLICLLIMVCIATLRLKPVPVHDNRKHWKKLIHQFAENEKEGVPS